MKFAELLARLSVALDEPLHEFVELRRHLREGMSRLAAKAAAEFEVRGPLDPAVLKRDAERLSDKEFVARWIGFRRWEHLHFRGRPGPGGGENADASSVSFFILAFLTGGPRRDVIARAMDMSFARYSPPADKPDEILCPVTITPYFADAVLALLSERDKFDRTVAIKVSFDFGSAEIVFTPETPEDRPVVSRFFISGSAKRRKAFFREATLVLRDQGWLFDAVNEPAEIGAGRETRPV